MRSKRPSLQCSQSDGYGKPHLRGKTLIQREGSRECLVRIHAHWAGAALLCNRALARANWMRLIELVN
jgi:hypothetical protein